MADNNGSTGKLGVILGGVVLAAAALFIFTGGELGGKKTIDSDSDLPPVTSTAPTK